MKTEIKYPSIKKYVLFLQENWWLGIRLSVFSVGQGPGNDVLTEVADKQQNKMSSPPRNWEGTKILTSKLKITAFSAHF